MLGTNNNRTVINIISALQHTGTGTGSAELLQSTHGLVSNRHKLKPRVWARGSRCKDTRSQEASETPLVRKGALGNLLNFIPDRRAGDNPPTKQAETSSDGGI